MKFSETMNCILQETNATMILLYAILVVAFLTIVVIFARVIYDELKDWRNRA